MEQQPGSQLHIGHLKNVLILARHGIAAIGAKLPAQEGKSAYESLGEVEKFLVEFEKVNGQMQQQGQMPMQQQTQALGGPDDSFEVHTVKIE